MFWSIRGVDIDFMYRFFVVRYLLKRFDDGMGILLVLGVCVCKVIIVVECIFKKTLD